MVSKESFKELLKISKAFWKIGRIFNRYKAELENAPKMISRLTNEKKSLAEIIRGVKFGRPECGLPTTSFYRKANKKKSEIM